MRGLLPPGLEAAVVQGTSINAAGLAGAGREAESPLLRPRHSFVMESPFLFIYYNPQSSPSTVYRPEPHQSSHFLQKKTFPEGTWKNIRA